MYESLSETYIEHRIACLYKESKDKANLHLQYVTYSNVRKRIPKTFIIKHFCNLNELFCAK
jgi:hypothetical protein